jgi:hypothetical protein
VHSKLSNDVDANAAVRPHHQLNIRTYSNIISPLEEAMLALVSPWVGLIRALDAQQRLLLLLLCSIIQHPSCCWCCCWQRLEHRHPLLLLLLLLLSGVRF